MLGLGVDSKSDLDLVLLEQVSLGSFLFIVVFFLGGSWVPVLMGVFQEQLGPLNGVPEASADVRSPGVCVCFAPLVRG